MIYELKILNKYNKYINFKKKLIFLNGEYIIYNQKFLLF